MQPFDRRFNMMDKRFYVYLHRRLDTGEVFYVGKGTGDRAYRKSKRNDRGIAWQRIAFNIEYSVEMYKENLTEEEAENIENDLINNPHEGWNLTNKVKKNKWIKLPTLEVISEFFRYDESSPSCLVWNKSNNSKKKNKLKVPGDTAGYLTERGYYRVQFNGNDISVHRIVYYLKTGTDPGRLLIDHINGVRSDNRIENLRLVTKQENSLNREQHRVFASDKENSNLYLHIYRDSVVFYYTNTNYKKVFPLSLFSSQEAAFSVARMFRNDYLILIKEQ